MNVEAASPPISAELVQEHLERAATGLQTHRADGLFLFRNTNILGFCGVPLSASDRLVCALLNAEGRMAFVVPAFEADMAVGLPPGSVIEKWREDEDPYVAVASAAKRLGVDSGKILLDPHTWLHVQAGLAAALPKAALALDAGLIESVRQIKSQEEIAAIRRACDDTGRIYPLVGQRLVPGMPERDLARDVLDRLRDDGLSPWGQLIQGGESASVPHLPSGPRQFQDGDLVIVDFVCQRDSYLGDMTRTFAIGQPTDEMREAYAVVRSAQAVAIEAIRPGVSCESVDRAARRVIEKAGLGDCFVHRLGHGIGLDVHEAPYLVRGNTQKLEPGMCVTVEPGVYLPGRFGIRIEDVVAVTEDGCEILSNTVPTDVSEALSY